MALVRIVTCEERCGAENKHLERQEETERHPGVPGRLRY